MTRTVAEIHQGMLDRIAADDDLNGKINSGCKTAIYRLFTYVVAVAIWMHEVLFDELVSEIKSLIARERKGTLQWYADMAKAFQYGHTLEDDKDTYAVADEDAQIVKHAKMDEISGNLQLKVAKEVDGELAPLSSSGSGEEPDELTPFAEYMQRIKYAGVRLEIVTATGDDLRLVYDVWYDPLVLDANGLVLDGSGREPAREAIDQFIKTLPFNGHFVPTALTDVLQKTEGVKIPVLKSAESRFGTNEFAVIDGYVIPRAGYLVVTDENLTLNYRPYVRS